jgi:DNA-binding MarR family transcriptional regulator
MTGLLQIEIKQGKPFADLRLEAYLNLVRTADLVQRTVEHILKPQGLTQPQYNVLRILRGAGAGGLPVGELGARLVSHDPDVTRLVDRLERRALVERTRASGDRRVVLVRITAAGLAQIDQADLDRQRTAAHADSIGRLSDAELTTLIDLCERIRGR